MRGLSVIACLFGLLAVAGGAFGAHALRGSVDATLLQAWHTAVEYQFFHAIALLFATTTLRAQRFAFVASVLFAVGIVLFSGSLYLLVLGAPRALGVITPFGGIAFMLAWALLAAGLVRPSRS